MEACYPTVLMTDGAAGISGFNNIVGRLNQHAMLRHTIMRDDQPFASIRPVSTYYRYLRQCVKDEQRYCVSSFAFVRPIDGLMVLSSPLGLAEVTLIDAEAMKLLHALNKPHDIASLGIVCGDEDLARHFLNLLGNAKALTEVDEAGSIVEKDNPALEQWEFHDLLFHRRSRLGRHDGPYGGAFPFKDRFEELPMHHPDAGSETLALFRPDNNELATRSASFHEILEKRESLRSQGDMPISARQLGEFLYRSARVKHSVAQAGVSWRPSPAGGALHEVEIYPIVSRCEGIAAGIYRYDPFNHQLVVLAGQLDVVRTLASMGGLTGNLPEAPQVLLVMSARFQRIQYKYRSMAYALMLKNLGALYQTFYLVATDMGLAPCGLGGGHCELFAQATGLDGLRESSIGEFMLGTRSTKEAAAAT